MQLAKDLNDLIHRFGKAMATAAEAVLIPRHKPGDPLPDLTLLEESRSKGSGQEFNFFPSQAEKIAGTLAGLKAVSRVWMVCEMGCGKSPMSLAAAWLLLRHKPFRIIVMCPGHLVRKWRREIEWLIPTVQCHIIRHFGDLLKFQAKAKTVSVPLVAVIGKETAKLGFDVDRPCAARKKAKFKVMLHSPDDMLPGDSDLRTLPLLPSAAEDEMPQYEVTRVADVACCPRCGQVVIGGGEDHNEPVSYNDYIAQDESVICTGCGERLLTNARGFRKNPHIDRYIQRKMKGVFDLLIADEVHELAAAESEQGNTFGTLASACRFTIALTGTLIGGKASDLHAPLWRMSPELLRQRSFNVHGFKGSRISAIARNERSFVKRYGVIEHQIVRSCRGESDDYGGSVRRGACGRRKSYKTNERPRPGINPDLFNHFLIDRAIFMGLTELGPALPALERVLIPCPMDGALKKAYARLDADLREAVKKRAHGKGPPALACTRIQVLDSYLDRPWGWEPVRVPAYDENGRRVGWDEVALPEDLGENHADEKDRKLLETVQGELRQGRRCAVYPQFTGIHDVREKIKNLLADSGVRAVLLPDTVKPVAREDWIARHVAEMDVLIAHPKRVMTGLDLIQFPSLIWYQNGYSTHVLRQASARARRPTQTKPCKVFFLYYANTIQEQAMALMGEKEAASQALEGVFDTHALRALMNGGKDDDIMAALADSLESGAKLDARAAWKAVDGRPILEPVFATVRTRRRIYKTSDRIQGLLFDLELVAQSA